MPYYRVIVWTKKRKLPYVGIRLMDQSNINVVYNSMKEKAMSTYRYDYIDIEVQMLSKLCKAVQEHVKKVEEV